MFHEGDLQSGIAKALQESKVVACFVTDEGEESQAWENDYLQDSSLKSSLSERAVLLRLKASSQEAGYLAAIVPLPKVPTFVIIEGGELKEYLTAGVPKDEFLRRVGALLESLVSTSQEQSEPSSSVPRVSTTTAPDNTTGLPTETTVRTESSAGPGANPTTRDTAIARGTSPLPRQDPQGETSSSANPRDKREDKSEEGDHPGKSSGRNATPQDDTPSSPHKASDSEKKYAVMQKRRQQEARDERARILKRVEDDKIERRKREAERKAEGKIKEGSEPTKTSSTIAGPQASSQSKECALQIRLFDGSTIRSRFPSTATIRADVRPWVDGHQTGNNAPYTFKQVLSPLPNKDLSISEEETSLQSQGLTPNATLILIPVQGYISAYEDSGSTGLVSRGVSAGYGIVSSGVGMVTGLLGSLVGGGPAAPAQQEPTTTTSSDTTPSAPAINVRTLRDQDQRDEHQFYNGNALNFEPRNEDGDKKDE